MKKGPGTYVFVNRSREDFLMHINVFGYLEEDVAVRYETLDHNLPILDIFLMPSEKNRIGGSSIQINGTLSGLESITAINLNRPQAAFQSCVTKKEITRLNLLPIKPGGGAALDNVAYALLSKDQKRYEVVRVLQQDTPTSVILRNQPSEGFELNDKLFRIIYGRAGPRGDFILKVRDDASNLPHLLRLVVDGEVYLRPIDFHLESGVINPLQGALKITDPEGKEETENE
jgi:hypothetical protein